MNKEIANKIYILLLGKINNDLLGNWMHFKTTLAVIFGATDIFVSD